MRTSVGLFAVLLLASVASAQTTRPNVLLITADDMNYDTPGYAGGRVPDITPNLDKLAAEGIYFRKAHVTVAVCQPSRSVLMTGRYPHRNGAEGFNPIRDGVPTLGVSWTPFLPFVYLPWWPMTPDPGPQAPVTSVTQWTWEQLWWDDRVLSVSKRDAYLHYITLPQCVARPFELAVNLHPADETGDRELLC